MDQVPHVGDLHQLGHRRGRQALGGRGQQHPRHGLAGAQVVPGAVEVRGQHRDQRRRLERGRRGPRVGGAAEVPGHPRVVRGRQRSARGGGDTVVVAAVPPGPGRHLRDERGVGGLAGVRLAGEAAQYGEVVRVGGVRELGRRDRRDDRGTVGSRHRGRFERQRRDRTDLVVDQLEIEFVVGGLSTGDQGSGCECGDGPGTGGRRSREAEGQGRTGRRHTGIPNLTRGCGRRGSAQRCLDPEDLEISCRDACGSRRGVVRHRRADHCCGNGSDAENSEVDGRRTRPVVGEADRARGGVLDVLQRSTVASVRAFLTDRGRGLPRRRASRA